MIGTLTEDRYYVGGLEVDRIYVGTNLVYEKTPVGAGKTAKVMFTSDAAYREDTGWNTVDQANPNFALYDTDEVLTGWIMNITGNDWDIDAAYAATAQGDFSTVALERSVYTYEPGATKVITITGLDSTKTYKLTFGSVVGYDAPNFENRSTITINGVSKDLDNEIEGQLYEQLFTVANPESGTIVASTTLTSPSVYAAVSALIIEELGSVTPSDLLSGASRIELPNPPFTKTGNDFSSVAPEKQLVGQLTSDGYVGTKFNTEAGCSCYMTEFSDGTGSAVGYYIYADTVYRDDGNSDSPTPTQPSEGEFVVLRKVSGEVGIYSTTDGVSFTLLYDFGTITVTNMIVGTIDTNKVFSPQMKGVTEEVDIDTLFNGIFDHRFKASDALSRSAGTPASNLEEVDVIPDAIGDRDISYGGVTTPNATRKWPIMMKQKQFFANNEQELSMIFMENESGIQYANTARSMPFPRTIVRVFMQPDYHIFEAYDNNFNREYWGEASERDSSSTPSGTTLRFTNDNSNTVDNVTLHKNAVNYMIIECIEDGQESESGKMSIKATLNGIVLNPSTHLETFRRAVVAEGFGTDTNSEMHGVIEQLYLYRLMTTEEKADVIAALNSYYKVGQTPKYCYSTDVVINKSGNTISVDYTFVPGASGLPEDEAGRKIHWWESGGGIQDGYIEPTLNDVVSFDRTAYPDQFLDGTAVRVNVWVQDTSGVGSWMPGVYFTAL